MGLLTYEPQYGKTAMGKQRRILLDAELLKFSQEHLCYELDMLVQAGRTFGFSMCSSPMDNGIANVALECFTLHTRNWVDFFYPSANVGRDDVLAQDFFFNGFLPSSFPAITAPLEKARKRAHKELSHITSERRYGSDPAKVWNWPEIICALLVPLRAFQAGAEPTKLHASVGEAIARLAGNFGDPSWKIAP